MAISMLGASTYTVTRFAQSSWTDGEHVRGAPSTFDIVASIQPLTGRELQDLPEGQRNVGNLNCYTETLLLTGEDQAAPDRLDYKGTDYEVQAVEDWTDHVTGLPHYKVRIAEVGADGF
jgi:hypothetical protein